MTRMDKINEVRKLRLLQNLQIKEIVRRTKLSRNTVRKIIRTDVTKFTYHRESAHPVTGGIEEHIKEWLIEDQDKPKKKKRKARRICNILRDPPYNYTGSYESIAKLVKSLKKELGQKSQEVFIPLYFEPGDAFQFDWGEVEAYIKGQLVTLQCGAVQLCHSRKFYSRSYPCQKQELLLDIHRRAFEYFGGVCKRGIYDNLKTAVQKILKGNHRNLQERFLRFTSHYLYKPEFCNPAKGNEKGRIEGIIGFIRRNFFTPVPRFDSIEELNEALFRFCLSCAMQMEHPEMQGKSRHSVYLEEKELFIILPGYGFDCCRENYAAVSTTSLVYFDNNRYSVPTEYVCESVLIKGYAEEVVISHNGKEIGRHKRIYGYKQNSFNPHHYLDILLKKPRAFRDGWPFKDWNLPEVFMRYQALLNDKYPDGDHYFAKTLLLLKEWPLKEVAEAIGKAITIGILGDGYLLTLLKQPNEECPPKIIISVKDELAIYKAQQKPPSYYDSVLRNNMHLEEIKK
jgi:transposase